MSSIGRAMLKLAAVVVAIALPDCVNPSLIGGELFVATRPDPRRQTSAFTLAAFTVTFLVGLALALGPADLIVSFLNEPGSVVKYAVFIVAGVALTAGGAFVLIRRGALTVPKGTGGHRSYGSAALIGASLAGLELLTAFPYFAAITLIVGSGVSAPGKLFLLLLYSVVYSLPLIAIAVTFAVLGDRAEAMVRPLGGWLVAHWPLVVGPLALAIGLGLVAHGIVELA